MAKTDVLVAGAGPTGLMLALWLARAGVKALLVDDKEGPANESRAVGVQARTMETYDMLGLGETALAQGTPARGAGIWRNGRRIARAVLEDMGLKTTPHPYMFIMGQDRTERMLLAELRARGGDVRYRTSLESFEQDDRRVVGRTRTACGNAEEVEAAYLAGCDGAHSVVRRKLGVGFSGGTYDQRYFVADVVVRGALAPDELGLCVAHTGFLAFFPMLGEGHFRVIGILPRELVDKPDLGFGDVQADVERIGGVKVERAFWFSTYNVQHRVADRFRQGRVFLLGDAGHLHSPVGAQGMNTGLMDATDLGWKLGMVVKGEADARILDSYEPERIPFAKSLVATTDRVFSVVSEPVPIVGSLRDLAVPVLFAVATHLPFLRRALIGLISQTRIHYRKSPLSFGCAGRVHGGDRLPWVPWPEGGSNFDALKILRPHLQVYGEVPRDLEAYAAAHRQIPLMTLPDGPRVREAGLEPGAVYFVRPDGYVGYAASRFEAAEFEGYLRDRWGLTVVGELARERS